MHDATLAAMESMGGSFVQQLAKLYRHADEPNRQRLETAFQDYFDRYAELAALAEGRRRERADHQ
jgi:hypothetical protein